MRTSVTVFSYVEGRSDSSTSIISTGDVSVTVLYESNDLVIKVTEDEVEVKTFYFRGGHWTKYSVIKTDF